MSPRIGKLVIGVMVSVFCACSAGDNQAPTLNLNVQSQQTYRLGQDVIRVEISANDPNGDPLSFGVDGAPDAPRVTFQSFDESAKFTWNPAPEDITDETPHRLIFWVEDARGARTERVFNAHIRPGNGVPTFETSSSQVYDVSSGEAFSFEVRVRDANNQSVTLFMESGPDGARFDKTGPKRGEFRWQPTDTQKNQRLHSAVFEADDGDNPPVNLEVSLILTDRGSQDTGGGCTDDDGFSNNHMRDGAALVELKEYSNLELCPGRPDWYQRTIFGGTTLEVVVDSVSGGSLEEVSLEIVDDRGSSVAQATTQSNRLLATFTPDGQGQYFVRVAALTEVSYSVSFAEP